MKRFWVWRGNVAVPVTAPAENDVIWYTEEHRYGPGGYGIYITVPGQSATKEEACTDKPGG